MASKRSADWVAVVRGQEGADAGRAQVALAEAPRWFVVPYAPAAPD